MRSMAWLVALSTVALALVGNSRSGARELAESSLVEVRAGTGECETNTPVDNGCQECIQVDDNPPTWKVCNTDFTMRSTCFLWSDNTKCNIFGYNCTGNATLYADECETVSGVTTCAPRTTLTTSVVPMDPSLCQ